MHQPERGGVKNEPHLIGRRAVARLAIRRQLHNDQAIELLAHACSTDMHQHLHDNVYCQRGQMENLIKLHKAPS